MIEQGEDYLPESSFRTKESALEERANLVRVAGQYYCPMARALCQVGGTHPCKLFDFGGVYEEDGFWKIEDPKCKWAEKY